MNTHALNCRFVITTSRTRIFVCTHVRCIHVRVLHWSVYNKSQKPSFLSRSFSAGLARLSIAFSHCIQCVVRGCRAGVSCSVSQKAHLLVLNFLTFFFLSISHVQLSAIHKSKKRPYKAVFCVSQFVFR